MASNGPGPAPPGLAEGSRLRYRRRVPKTIIVSAETARNLIEAHASLAAWYYQLSEALHGASITATPPSMAQRLAFVEQLAAQFPELGAVAAAITDPRPYVPPPVVQASSAAVVPAAPPAVSSGPQPPQPLPAEATAPPPMVPPSGGEPTAPTPPPMVDPSKVKYEE